MKSLYSSRLEVEEESDDKRSIGRNKGQTYISCGKTIFYSDELRMGPNDYYTLRIISTSFFTLTMQNFEETDPC